METCENVAIAGHMWPFGHNLLAPVLKFRYVSLNSEDWFSVFFLFLLTYSGSWWIILQNIVLVGKLHWHVGCCVVFTSAADSAIWRQYFSMLSGLHWWPRRRQSDCDTHILAGWLQLSTVAALRYA